MKGTDRRNFYYKKSLKALEFDKVCEILATYSSISKTAETIKKIIPLYDRGCVIRQQQEVSEACAMLLLNQRLPMGNLSDDIDIFIGKAVKGITLTPSDFMVLAKLMTVSLNMSSYHSDSNAKTESLDVLFERLFKDKQFLNKINRIFPDGEHVADDASVELSRIRRRISAAMQKIKDSLDRYIKNESVAPHLQDAIVTIRYDRFVIPVKADNRGDIKGLVHDTSNTGSTLFVEPLFVIEENNNIRKLENEEKQEIERILKELTQEISDRAHELLLSYKSLLSLDYIFAKARYSYQNNMSAPTICNDKRVVLKKARHPLISKDVMVPLSVTMGDGIDTIIVTGPNTGGKTVFLKTIGLFCLMAKAGMHVPCDNAELFIFDKVYADIGDEQSIEQSHSTFSSHLKNIKNILANTSSGCLVLFDELGGGTDPVEGAALAEAVIQKVRDYGGFCACTTHYSELKTYALETAGVINASFEFDLENLSPTYRLNIGIPGKSYAFEISKHLELQNDVIEHAKSLVDEDVRRFDRVVDELSRQKSEYEKLKRELKKKEIEINLKQHEIDEKARILEKNTEKELDAARTKARQIIEKARRDSNQFLEELKKQKEELEKSSMQRIKSVVKRGAAALDSDDLYSSKEQTPAGEPIGDKATLGQIVFVSKLSKKGEIVSLSGQNARVNCGGIVVSVKTSEIYTPEEEKKPIKDKKSTFKFERPLNRNIRMELDIRGQMVVDACEEIDRFIDDAILDHLSTVTIIHGKGTGALRAGVHAFLKTHKRVKKFNLGAYGEGDSGVTIVELK